MIDSQALTIEVQNTLALLDASACPWIYDYLSSLTDENGEVSEPPYQIATTILQQREPAVLPAVVVDLVETLLQMEIADGNADAMNDLGALYYGGDRGFEQDIEQAVYYYHMAAQHGCRQAQENLGYCYYYGRVGEPDYEKAFHYFAPGAFDGHLISLYKIGDMYLHGLYVAKNEIEAFHIFMRCIEAMTPEAEGTVAGPVYLRLGRMFLDGLGTEQNSKTALVCFQKAESFLYDMVSGGNTMYRRSLEQAIQGQQEARCRRRVKSATPASGDFRRFQAGDFSHWAKSTAQNLLFFSSCQQPALCILPAWSA